ncbi:hypothetical protein [Rhizobium phaseoli]|uniref:Uncharacterized protein n=1 Tax=Rhizobium phaseoli TaxID=396 RepID=A0ABN4QS33_9HYPH|nr:hypothetical protein [Rhizobium phaseoli]ANL87078.1 hypothetical protein AMC81_PA00055 [Rhizobium phaseoli]ANL93587.1 hypothetical protein AMC80_PA00055 [Rhizobium phaseoli]
MSNILQFPTFPKPPEDTFQAAEIVRVLEAMEYPPAREQLAELHEKMNAPEFFHAFGEIAAQRVDLDYQSRERWEGDTDEPPFWSEQYREASDEIAQAFELIRRAKKRLWFTLSYAFETQKAINPGWMYAHIGKAHKAILFQTFDNKDGNHFVSVARDYDGRYMEHSDADMALIGFVLRDAGFRRYDCDGGNGPQWFIPGEITDAMKTTIGEELEPFDFLAISWEDVTRY